MEEQGNPTTQEIVISSGRRIKLRVWGKGPRSILLVHGLGAHCLWFSDFAAALVPYGFKVLSFDHAGFGERASEAVPSFHLWIDDLCEVFGEITKTGEAPLLAGNSMGGLLACAAATRVEVPRLLIFSPGFDGGSSFTFAYRLKAFVRAILTPGDIISLPYGVDAITSSPEAQAMIGSDSLARLDVPARFLLELLRLSTEALKVKSLECPLFMATAGEDRIVSTMAAMRFYQTVSAPEKFHKHFKEARHDLMFEECRFELARQVSDWSGNLEPAAV